MASPNLAVSGRMSRRSARSALESAIFPPKKGPSNQQSINKVLNVRNVPPTSARGSDLTNLTAHADLVAIAIGAHAVSWRGGGASDGTRASADSGTSGRPCAAAHDATDNCTRSGAQQCARARTLLSLRATGQRDDRCHQNHGSLQAAPLPSSEAHKLFLPDIHRMTAFVWMIVRSCAEIDKLGPSSFIVMGH